jgi:methylmalonyl-CoA mutase cobalamin-binding subunit
LARAAARTRRDKIVFVGGVIASDDVSTFEMGCEEEEEEHP